MQFSVNGKPKYRGLIVKKIIVTCIGDEYILSVHFRTNEINT